MRGLAAVLGAVPGIHGLSSKPCCAVQVVGDRYGGNLAAATFHYDDSKA